MFLGTLRRWIGIQAIICVVLIDSTDNVAYAKIGNDLKPQNGLENVVVFLPILFNIYMKILEIVKIADNEL